jgi:tetratricopeptide (TPR) repeat protein
LIYYEYAYEIRKSRQDQLGLARSVIGLEFIYSLQGRYDQAIEYNQQGIHILTKLLSAVDHNLIGLALSNIGKIYYSKRQYDLYSTPLFSRISLHVSMIIS